MLLGGAFLYGEARQFGDLSSRGDRARHILTIL